MNGDDGDVNVSMNTLNVTNDDCYDRDVIVLPLYDSGENENVYLFYPHPSWSHFYYFYRSFLCQRGIDILVVHILLHLGNNDTGGFIYHQSVNHLNNRLPTMLPPPSS